MRVLFWVMMFLCVPGLASAQQSDARLERLERDINTLQQYLYRSGTPSPIATTPSPAPNAAASAQLTQLEEQLRQMNGRIEKIEFLMTKLDAQAKRIEALQKAQADIIAAQQKASVETPKKEAPSQEEANADVKEDSTKKAPKPVMRLVKEAPEQKEVETASTEEDPQQMYDAAFALLSSGKYAQAETVLKDFVSRHKKHALTGNAYYWLGETYYARESYDKAAVQFLKGYQEFPKSSKAPDNLLKLGISLENLGKTKEACTTFTKLTQEFPKANTTLKKRVSDESKKLACNG